MTMKIVFSNNISILNSHSYGIEIWKSRGHILVEVEFSEYFIMLFVAERNMIIVLKYYCGLIPKPYNEYLKSLHQMAPFV